jgi:hypothetical protein
LPPQSLQECIRNGEEATADQDYARTLGLIYHHWQKGAHLRALMYGCLKGGTWDRVEGEAEEWEQECFWDEESLEMNLKEATSAAERKKLKKLWTDGALGERNITNLLSTTLGVG